MVVSALAPTSAARRLGCFGAWGVPAIVVGPSGGLIPALGGRRSALRPYAENVFEQGLLSFSSRGVADEVETHLVHDVAVSDSVSGSAKPNEPPAPGSERLIR